VRVFRNKRGLRRRLIKLGDAIVFNACLPLGVYFKSALGPVHELRTDKSLDTPRLCGGIVVRHGVLVRTHSHGFPQGMVLSRECRRRE